MTDKPDWFCSQPGCGKLHSEHVAERQTMTRSPRDGEDYDSAAVRATGKRLLDEMRPLNDGEAENGESNGR